MYIKKTMDQNLQANLRFLCHLFSLEHHLFRATPSDFQKKNHKLSLKSNDMLKLNVLSISITVIINGFDLFQLTDISVSDGWIG